MSAHDQHFFDNFLLVLGSIVGITIGIFILANYISSQTAEVHALEDAVYQEQVQLRIAPAGRVAVTGEEAEESAAAADAEPATVVLTGPQVYNAACLACHGAGIGGAPKVGDAGAWSARIAQGADVLNDHALNGYQGSAGYMPPKGGRVDLSDAEIVAAVDYMVEESR